MLHGAQLVVGAAAGVGMVLVELGFGKPQNKIRRSAMANHALSAAGIVPCEITNTRWIGYLVAGVGATGSEQSGIGSFRIPLVGIAVPFAILPGHEPGFDPFSA